MKLIERLTKAIEDVVAEMSVANSIIATGDGLSAVDCARKELAHKNLYAALAELEALAVVGSGAIASKLLSLTFGTTVYWLQCEWTEDTETWYLSRKLHGGLTYDDVCEGDTWQETLCQAGLLPNITGKPR